MITSTLNKRRLATIALIAGALTVLVPVAQAQTSFAGSPDAIDRAVAAKQAQKLSAIDARERGMVERPTHHSVPPDAFERALITHADSVRSQTVSMLNSRERALGERPTTSSPSPASGRFDWNDFSLGAGAGFMLGLIALGAGVAAIRRTHQRVTTA